MTDYRDAQVKGLDRFIPTRRSAILLISLLTVPFVVFVFLIDNQSFIFSSFTMVSRFYLIIISSLATALVIAIILCIELAVAVNHSKHSKLTHFSTIHPQMTFKWLADNASLKHYLLLASIFSFGIALGYYVR